MKAAPAEGPPQGIKREYALKEPLCGSAEKKGGEALRSWL